MTERSYGQYCGLAGALDLVGERWTLLIVRELMSGPKRYTDLADGLPGIGTSLLAKRLAKLESVEVIDDACSPRRQPRRCTTSRPLATNSLRPWPR